VGGSGGGIRIDVGSLSGTGAISANGSAGVASGGSGGGGGRVAIYYQDAAGFDLTTKVTAFGGTGSGAPNGGAGTVFLEQVIAMLLPTDEEIPVRRASLQNDGTVQLVLLDLVPLGSSAQSTDFEDDLLLTIDDPHSVDQLLLTIDQSSPLLALKQLIADVQSLMPNISNPQRRVFSESSVLSTQSSALPEHTNRYAALAAAKIDDDADLDPIYSYDANGNRTSMIDPTGLTTYNYDVLNRLTSITNNQGLTTTFAYDALGRRTSMT